MPNILLVTEGVLLHHCEALLCLLITIKLSAAVYPNVVKLFRLHHQRDVLQADINKLADDFEEQLKASREKLEVSYLA